MYQVFSEKLIKKHKNHELTALLLSGCLILAALLKQREAAVLTFDPLSSQPWLMVVQLSAGAHYWQSSGLHGAW